MKKIIISVLLIVMFFGASIPMPASADPALPLESFKITHIYVSDYAYGHVLPAPDQDWWHEQDLTANGTQASSPNDKKYVRIDYRQMGQLVGTSSISLDGRSSVTGNYLHALDEDGNVIEYGMTYGWDICDVFEIDPDVSQRVCIKSN